jgi:magnesium-dependent phosphatase 1
LKKRDIPIAAASRTEAPELAREMLKLLRLSLPSLDSPLNSSQGGTSTSTTALSFFSHLQIYPGSKIRHFEALHAATGIKYEDMLFFDDEARNRETERLGVVMWLVRDGVSVGEVDEGVRCWRKRNNKSR